MKKILILAVLSSAMLFTGCGDSNSKDSSTKEESNVKLKDWYPIDGGYINLRHVKMISSKMTDYFQHDFGAITKSNIEKAKSNKISSLSAPSKAYIAFDGFKVYLPNADENNKEAVYNSWLKEFENVTQLLGDLDDWYPIDGGYINLRHVKTISSKMTDYFQHDFGAITKSNIEKAKSNKISSLSAPSKAYIAFDGSKVYLPNADENNKSYIYDSWLREFQEVEQRLSKMK